MRDRERPLSGMPTIRSELPLKAELYLPGVQRFNQTTVCIESIIRAHENRVGVVGQVVDTNSKQKDSMILPRLESLRRTKIDVEKASFVKWISSQSVRARRNRICAGPVEVRRRERVRCGSLLRDGAYSDQSSASLTRELSRCWCEGDFATVIRFAVRPARRAAKRRISVRTGSDAKS